MEKFSLYTQRIISGITYIYCGDVKYIVKPLTTTQKYRAEEIYYETIENCKFEEILNEEQIIDLMIQNGKWSKEKDIELKEISANIDKYKIELFNSYFQAQHRDSARRQIKKLKERLVELTNEKHSMDQFTDVGLARIAKSLYSIGVSLYNLDDTRVWPGESYLSDQSHLLEQALSAYRAEQIDSEFIRKLSRIEPWKAIWSVGKSSDIFGIPAADYTDDQKTIVLWSKMYDSIQESQDCPPEEMFDDDDYIDGWLLIQNQKFKDARYKSQGESMFGDKAKKKDGNQEIFVPINNEEDFKRVMAINDSKGRLIQNQRLATIDRVGKVSEEQMPDSKIQLKQQAAQQLRQHIGK